MAPPRFRGYKPYGFQHHNDAPVELFFEEYEAIKLADYKMMNHKQAAALMGISRPTFARIYENARQKIAKALVETKEILTATGNSYSDSKWNICNDCNARYTIPIKRNSDNCPLCNSEKTESIDIYKINK
jgi:predicted DNA-binding protein (UPF0251 family)